MRTNASHERDSKSSSSHACNSFFIAGVDKTAQKFAGGFDPVDLF